MQILGSKPNVIATILGWLVFLMPVSMALVLMPLLSGEQVPRNLLASLPFGLYAYWSISLMLLGMVDPQYRKTLFDSKWLKIVFCQTFPVLAWFPNSKLAGLKLGFSRSAAAAVEPGRN